eukprot:13102119-Alexandrium_andersonii.AAC.1
MKQGNLCASCCMYAGDRGSVAGMAAGAATGGLAADAPAGACAIGVVPPCAVPSPPAGGGG